MGVVLPQFRCEAVEELRTLVFSSLAAHDHPDHQRAVLGPAANWSIMNLPAVFITGAAAGIGRATALTFARAGYLVGA